MPADFQCRSRYLLQSWNFPFPDQSNVVAGLYRPEKIPEGERLSPATLVGEIGRLCGDDRAVFIECANDIAAYVAENSKSGDIILVMSNGSFDRVQERILGLLQARFP